MGRFLLGFAIGAGIGVAAVVLTAPRSGSALRQQIDDLVQGALEAARQAIADQEREMWAAYRARLAEGNAPTPAQNPPDSEFPFAATNIP